MSLPLKMKLYNACLDHIRMRIISARENIALARESAANETKSSAGDKYETAREMLQQDIDRNLAQLAAAQELESVMQKMDPQRENDIIVPGSIAVTGKNNYYISVAAGRLVVDDTTYMAISAASPVGRLLAGKKAGDHFVLNGESIEIVSVC